ncbi:MAG: hypothetical protein JO294_09700 [Alphaproteobacteria bacterium]|nr:hypothetical protein [Alphaproteobacteria bacterium]
MARAKKAAKKTKKRKTAKAAAGRRSTKKATRRTTGRKTTARKAPSRKTGRKAATRKAAKKAAPRKATRKASGRNAKSGSRGEFGEGNYKASRRFRQDQENFVRENKDRIPEMGREAEEALDGPEGKDLANAAAEAASHSVGNS